MAEGKCYCPSDCGCWRGFNICGCMRHEYRMTERDLIAECRRRGLLRDEGGEL
jgi:hypothetical protein